MQAATQSTANAALVLGAVTDTIEVTAAEISLQTEQPIESTTIQEALVQDLPQIMFEASSDRSNQARPGVRFNTWTRHDCTSRSPSHVTTHHREDYDRISMK